VSLPAPPSSVSSPAPPSSVSLPRRRPGVRTALPVRTSLNDEPVEVLEGGQRVAAGASRVLQPGNRRLTVTPEAALA
jgi:hypothetical protein